MTRLRVWTLIGPRREGGHRRATLDRHRKPQVWDVFVGWRRARGGGRGEGGEELDKREERYAQLTVDWLTLTPLRLPFLQISFGSWICRPLSNDGRSSCFGQVNGECYWGKSVGDGDDE